MKRIYTQLLQFPKASKETYFSPLDNAVFPNIELGALRSETTHKGVTQFISFVDLSCLNALNIWHLHPPWDPKH